jgi:hypothetical protein
MKNYICLDGNKIEISDETAKNLKEQFKEPEFDLKRGDTIYFPAYDDAGADAQKISSKRNLNPWESKSEENILWIEAVLKLKNWADANNEVFEDDYHYLAQMDGNITIGKYRGDVFEGIVYFSSKEIAQKAIDYFGKAFIKLCLGVTK